MNNKEELPKFVFTWMVPWSNLYSFSSGRQMSSDYHLFSGAMVVWMALSKIIRVLAISQRKEQHMVLYRFGQLYSFWLWKNLKWMDGKEGGGGKDVLILSFEKTNSCEIRLPSACIFQTQKTPNILSPVCISSVLRRITQCFPAFSPHESNTSSPRLSGRSIHQSCPAHLISKVVVKA